MTLQAFDPETAFQRAFGDIGPQWHSGEGSHYFFDRRLRYADSIPSALVGAATSLLEKVELEKRATFPPIFFGLIDNLTFNCFARKDRAFERYYAGMSVVVPLALLEMACHYFSVGEIFPEVGDPERCSMIQLDASAHPPMFLLLDGEASLRFKRNMDEGKVHGIHGSLRKAVQYGADLKVNERNPRATEVFKYYDALLELLLPECPVRRLHCEYMANALVHFLWIHEIAHITNGHLIELRARTKRAHSSFHEFYLGQFEGSSLSGSIDCLAMEFDADIDAALIMLGLIMSDIDIESDEAPYVSRHARVEIFVFALVAFFTSAATREVATNRLGTHPPAMLRLQNIVVHLVGATKQKGELQSAMVAGYRHFQAYCEAAGHRWMPQAIDAKAHASFGEGRWWEIYRHRQVISKGYDKHKLGNLRVFLQSLGDDFRQSPLFQLGPEPDWWT